MTDEEIIKALECCSGTKHNSCHDCPLDNKGCEDALERYALDLINRKDAEIDILIRKKEKLRDEICELQAEIERLRNALMGECMLSNCTRENEIKSEAIKDVLLTLEAEAESSDKYLREYDNSKEQKAYNQALWNAYNIVKELMEELK